MSCVRMYAAFLKQEGSDCIELKPDNSYNMRVTERSETT